MSQKEALRVFRRKKWMKIIGAIAGIFLILLLLCSIVRIQNVDIEGNTRYTDEEIEELVFSDAWSRNPLIFLIREHTTSHKKIPFIDKYSVTLKGFRTVEVIVYEKSIMGYVNRMGCYMYFDSDGYVVESSSEIMEDIPGINGLSASYIVLGEKLPVGDEDLLDEILNISQYLQTTTISWHGKDEQLVHLIETIDFDKNKNVTLSVDDIHVYLGSSTDMEEKLVEMSSILPELYGKKGTLYLDSYQSSVANPSYVFK